MTYFLHGNIIAAGEKRDIDIFASTTQKRGIVLKTTSTGVSYQLEEELPHNIHLKNQTKSKQNRNQINI